VILKLEEVYRSRKRDLRIEVKRAKASAWDDLIRTIDQDPWGLPYRIVLKKLRRSTPSITEILNPEILNSTIEKLFPTDPFWNLGTVSNTEEVEWRDEYDVDISELCNILRKRSGANKAPGMDGIKAIFLKHIPEIFLMQLRNIYNMYMRKEEFPKLWKKSILVFVPKGEMNLLTPKVRPIVFIE